MDRVLEGVKVVELSQFASCPASGRMLADMGADVIKVEGYYGDPMRKSAVGFGVPAKEDESPMWQLANGGKRSIALDLKNPEALKVMHKLLADADIFITNTRMKGLTNLGLDYETLHKLYPRMVYGHISGYGLKGKEAWLPGYDSTAYWARGGGLMDLPLAGKGPLCTPYSIGDVACGMALVTGVTAALHKQKVAGEGELVLVSLFGTAVYLNSYMVISTQKGSEEYGYADQFPKDRYSPPTPLGTTYTCKDGKGIMILVTEHEKSWAAFCGVIGREDLIEDERFSTMVAARVPENCKALMLILEDIMATKNADEWLMAFGKANIATSVAQHFSDVSTDPMAVANGYVSNYTFPNGHTSVTVNSPIQFKENAAVDCPPAPALNQNGEEILKELGYTDEQIAALREQKATR